MLLVGVSYFIASGMLDIAENVSGRAKLFLVLTDAFLDAFLILWIFTSLSKTLEQLQVSLSFQVSNSVSYKAFRQDSAD